MDSCEHVQRKFLRSVLGVRTGTPNVAVLGELGRFPVAHTATLAICRFWNRLVAMPDTRLTKQAFLENCALASRPGRTSRSSACWAAQERKGKEGLPFTRTRGLLAYWRGSHLQGR